jgi:hypothetical protein
MAFLLYLNITNFIVGAGVGCKLPTWSEHCFPDILNGRELHWRLTTPNMQDRVILNRLQFPVLGHL